MNPLPLTTTTYPIDEETTVTIEQYRDGSRRATKQQTCWIDVTEDVEERLQVSLDPD